MTKSTQLFRSLVMVLACACAACEGGVAGPDGGGERDARVLDGGRTRDGGGADAPGARDGGAGRDGGGGCAPSCAPGEDPVILDDFSDLRTNAILPTPTSPPAPIWNPYYMAGDPTAAGGVLSFPVDGSPQVYFAPIDDNGRYFLRRVIESGTWSNTGLNRLRFRFRAPDGLAASNSGQHNVEIGTFLHEGSSSDGPWSGSDDNNWHFYHFYDFPSDGLVYHVILDTYADHQRGIPDSGGDREFPGGNTYNYFSMMTSFYIDIPYETVTGTMEIETVSLFYEDNASVPLAQVHSLNGAYDPATHTIKLGWNRRADQSRHPYEIRWSFSPITDFAAAALAGAIDSPDTDDYNGVHFEFSEPSLAGHDLVYVAIQPGGTDSFRQMWIELR